jgi:hypothetical protein
MNRLFPAGLCLFRGFSFVSFVRYGPGPNGYMGTILRPMIQSGAFFGFFFTIGHVLRCDDMEVHQRQNGYHIQPIIKTTLVYPIMTKHQQIGTYRMGSLTEELLS